MTLPNTVWGQEPGWESSGSKAIGFPGVNMDF